MRRLAVDQQAVDAALTIPLSRTRPDCRYDDTVPSWHCSVEKSDGGSTGARSEVVRYERPAMPVWRVVAAGAPDA